MGFEEYLVIGYFVVGFVLAYYWFGKDYSESYEKAVETERIEKGMASLLLMALMLMWPIKMAINLVKKGRI